MKPTMNNQGGEETSVNITTGQYHSPLSILKAKGGFVPSKRVEGYREAIELLAESLQCLLMYRYFLNMYYFKLNTSSNADTGLN